MLTRYDAEGIELVIDQATGEAFATQAGYARMSGKSKSAISDRVKGVRSEQVKMAEIQTPGGKQGVRLISAELVFEWLLDDNRELAKAMGKCGATVYLHQLAGFKVKSEATESEPQVKPLPPTAFERATAVNNLHSALQGFEIDLKNPRIKQELKDLVCDVLGVGQLSSSDAVPAPEVWLGVAEKAERMGYSPTVISRFRVRLGKRVSKLTEEFQLERQKEFRLCNGTQRKIWVYRDCPELDQVIQDFMNDVAIPTALSFGQNC